jgi:cytochrome b pre-mRNA-processing protein 3
MFSRLFGRGKSGNRDVVDALYGEIVAAARQPAFYAEWGVPDTPLGRYEMLSAQLFLVLRRLGTSTTPAARQLAQDLTDEFFKDIDHSIRELGVGDMGVPKRMKKLARMFYGRVAAYDAAVAAGDESALAEALRRNVRPDATEWPQARRLAAHLLAAAAALDTVAEGEILSGRPRLVPPASPAREAAE